MSFFFNAKRDEEKKKEREKEIISNKAELNVE
jgi:hypothetical protein